MFFVTAFYTLLALGSIALLIYFIMKRIEDKNKEDFEKRNN
jgi:hypothetical protein